MKTKNNKKTSGRKKDRLGDAGLASVVALGMLLAPLPTLAIVAGTLVATKRRQRKRMATKRQQRKRK